jgi:hypothetical protein
MTELKHNVGAALTQLLDPYSRQARLQPALIVVVPVALLVVVWFPALWSVWGVVLTVASSCGVTLLLSQMARDRGKRLEPELYGAWGGKPSVALLRHRDRNIDENTKARYRAFLASQLPSLNLPTPSEEEADGARADRAYESATAWLLTQTRDTKKFGLLFRENISYGFRRNLWGLKPIGLAIAVASALASTAVLAYSYVAIHAAPPAQVVIVTLATWVLALLWAIWLTPSWVRIPADAYGRQLLAACDTLSSSRSTAAKRTKTGNEQSNELTYEHREIIFRRQWRHVLHQSQCR